MRQIVLFETLKKSKHNIGILITERMHQQKTKGRDQLDLRTDPDDASFYDEWPMKLDTVSCCMTSKISVLSNYCNAKEIGEIRKFFQGWENWGRKIGTKWNDVIKRTDYSSLLGRGEGTHQERSQVMGDVTASAQPKGVPSSLPKELAELDIGKMQKQFEKLAGDIRDKDIKLKRLEESNTRLTDQLSAEMNKSVSRDESNIESISTTNRPLRLADDFKEFCTKQWMSGKEAMDSKTQLSEMEKCIFLNRLLWLSYSEMNSTLERLKVNVLHLINDPFMIRKEIQGLAVQKPSEQEKVKLPHDIVLAVTTYLRLQNPIYDFASETESVLARATSDRQQQHSLYLLRSSRRLKAYCMRACELSWLMLIQRPPMIFDMHSAVGHAHNPQEQELAFGSEKPSTPGANVLYYVYPAVYHGEPAADGRLLVKGTVYVGMKKR